MPIANALPMLPSTPSPAQAQAQTWPPAAQRLQRAELLREAEAQQALAELFPHLQLDALRAIQELFPLQARIGDVSVLRSAVH